jgi:phytanoyl-CoA hydroxylase
MRHWENHPADTARAFDLNGFAAFPNFFAGDEFSEITAALSRYIREVAPTRPDTEVFYEDKLDRSTLKQMQDLHVHDPFFAQLLHGRCARLASVVLGEPARAVNLQYFNKPPGIGQPTPAHQDGYYFKLKPNHAVTLWLALEDVDHENGCVRYVQGSHRLGLRAHGKSGVLGFSQGILDFGLPHDRAHAIACPAAPGDLLAHHSLTIHWADANQSATRSRRALGLVYFAGRCVVDEAAKQAYADQLHLELRARGKI